MDQATRTRLATLDQVMRNVPREYQDKKRLHSDIQGLFKVFGTLQPHTGTFQGHGRSVTLFYLYGVLPISYKGNNYNIPVTVYFDAGYPRQCPRCFVSPTENMAVAPNHPNVDAQGMFFGEFIKSWSERSTITELISVMMSAFGAAPPVYAVQAPQAQQQQQMQQQQQPPQQQQQPPMYGGAGAGGYAGPGAGGGFAGAGGGFAGAGGAGYAGGGAGGGYAGAGAGGMHAGAGGGYAGALEAQQPSLAGSRLGGGGGAGGGGDLVKRTTEALRQRWPTVVGKLVAETNEQTAKRNEIKAQYDQLEADLAALRHKAETQDAQYERMGAKEAELAAFVDANADKEPDPEDLKPQFDPDTQQVLENMAEELALEEFLVALDELLAAKKIAIDDFIREVRDVSRRKFMCLMQRKKSAAAVRVVSS